jgi:hypothetical protein
MRKSAAAIVVSFILTVLASASWTAPLSVTQDEITTWTRYTVPLPRSVTFQGKVSVSCAEVSIVLPASSDIKVPQARKELRQALGLSDSGDNPTNPAFTITLQLGGSESDPLVSLLNSDQSYRIFPEADNSGLRLVALQPAGLYYAAKTLSQMLPWKRSGGTVQIPLVTIQDWPEMADRGLWGCDHFLWLKWMGDRKMNIGEQISTRSVTSDGKGHSGFKDGRETMYTEGPYYGVKPVPATLHLSSLGDCGLFTYYPQLIGVNGPSGSICYSRPEFPPVLADFMCDLASYPNVDEVDTWMTEDFHNDFGPGCRCDACLAGNRNVLEAKAIQTAIDIAKLRLAPRNVVFRVLTAQQTEPDNAKCFAATTPDVKWWYYNGDLTYTSARKTIISQAVADLAASGRYAGVCPNISAMGCNKPFSSADFVNYRMTEFNDKKLNGIIGYAVPPPLALVDGFNVEAEAEWAWNPKGRDKHEFAAALAVREGNPDPEKFAQWSDAIGPVEFDMYGSDWPECEGKYQPGYVSASLLNGKLPGLGEVYPGFRGCWGEFKTAKQLDDDVILAGKALCLAEQMGIKKYYYESLWTDGNINALRALYKLKSLVVGGSVSAANRETARYWFGVFINSVKQASSAITKWAIECAGDASSYSSTAGILQRMADGDGGSNPGMIKVANDLGCAPNLVSTLEPAMSIAAAKKLGPGAIVKLYGDVITGGSGSTCFIEEPDRTCGIRVNSSTSLIGSSSALILGTVANNNGELVINADLVQAAAATQSVDPVAVSVRNLGGGAYGGQPAIMEWRKVKENNVWVRKLLPVDGLNNLGLFVRLSGIVTHVGPDYFYIDDGSHCDDDSGYYGVRVVCADGSWDKPAEGEYVTIDGMSSCYSERGSTWRALYVPAASNIVVIPVPLELILDEDQATLAGSWTYTPSASGAAYNDDYDAGMTQPSETATARWTPKITRPGNYDIYVMYAGGADRTTSANYRVVYDGGAQTVPVDQTANGGVWVSLGKWPLATGTAGYVELTNASADAGKVVVADAVKFVRASGGTPPAIVTQPTSQAACLGGTATITVGATGTSPLSYQWRKGNTSLTNAGHYSGATSSALVISGCDASDAANNYNCLVTNIYGNASSNNASLIVGDPTTAPTALPASGVGTDAITWNWSPAPGAIGYKLWTAATGGTQIGGTLTSTTYTEKPLDPGTLYTRYVEAIYGCGASNSRTQLGPTATQYRYCVENGDFEGGFTNGIGNHWQRDTALGTFTQSTSIKRDGTSAQKLYDAVGNDPFTAYLYQKINVQPNRNYLYRVYHRREKAGGFTVVFGYNTVGNLTPTLTSSSSGSGASAWWVKNMNFTSGATGVVTVMFCGGSNKNDTVGYVDGVYLLPQAPTASGGAATISAGGTATLTASGGFDGASSELHWYTGAGGTGVHVGTGTALVVSPTTTTTYYPRWESYLSGSCPSDDGPAVTVTVQ